MPPMPNQDVDRIELLQENLRYLLNQWDPIGVADIVDDEYDCMLVPLWLKLIGVVAARPSPSTSGTNLKTIPV